MAYKNDRKTTLRANKNATLNIRKFHSIDYYTAKELNHHHNGISFESNFELEPGTIIQVKRERCSEGSHMGKTCKNCRTTTLVKIEKCYEKRTRWATTYVIDAKYLEYGIGY